MYRSVMAHLAPVFAAVTLMLLLSLVISSLANPLALAYGAVATLAVTLMKDRRIAIGLAVIAVLGFVVTAWALAQPRYM